MTDLELLDCILDKPIAYYKVFFHVTQDAKSGLFLSQLYYWSKKMNHDWFYKTIESWEEETGLNRREQETIKKKLIKLGLLETKRKNVPATLHFKFNFTHFITLAKQYYSQFGRNCQSSMAETAKQDCLKVPNLNGRNCQSITENNTEITTEKEKDTTNVVSKKSSISIPYQTILDKYHEYLPELPRVEVLNDMRKSKLKTTWMNYEKARLPEFWDDYFQWVRKSDFLMGRLSGNRQWKADFEFLITYNKLINVVEGKYHNRGE